MLDLLSTKYCLCIHAYLTCLLFYIMFYGLHYSKQRIRSSESINSNFLIAQVVNHLAFSCCPTHRWLPFSGFSIGKHKNCLQPIKMSKQNLTQISKYVFLCFMLPFYVDLFLCFCCFVNGFYC